MHPAPSSTETRRETQRTAHPASRPSSTRSPSTSNRTMENANLDGPPEIRVALVDDEPLYLEGLRCVLEQHGLRVVAEASDGHTALWAAENCRPDVILMDLHMPGMNGVEATRKLRERHPEINIVALTIFDDDRSVFDALREGAVGYLLKGTEPREIAEAVRATKQGTSVVAPNVTRRLVDEFARMALLVPPEEPSNLGLSEREMEVLRLVARGACNKEIAHALHLAQGTVKNHMTRILEKMEVSSRTAAALKAREHGIV